MGFNILTEQHSGQPKELRREMRELTESRPWEDVKSYGGTLKPLAPR
jgi:hypothetical protein